MGQSKWKNGEDPEMSPESYERLDSYGELADTPL